MLYTVFETVVKMNIAASLTAAAVLICVSTVFLKQHSIIDIIAALPICAAAYWVCYKRKN